MRVAVKLVTFSSGGASSWTEGRNVETDAEGRFALEDVPRDGVFLRVTGPDALPADFAMEDQTAPESCRLEVALRCHFKLEVTGGAAQSFRMLNAAGEPLSIYRFRGGGWGASLDQRLEGGRSGVLAVSEDAVTLAVEREDGTSVREPVVLEHGDVNEIRVTLR